ncbi:MAG: peptide ABC transporter substrate-binding protein [Clostridiales bacterium]|nr:peptide ABC transporter substrate-binding protein [Eubacteriales bacterium]MDH7565160.1 peptide ABC transporter substrate-binding protein [Clostridiales bacterium]
MLKKYKLAILGLITVLILASCKAAPDNAKNGADSGNQADSVSSEARIDRGPVKGGVINIFSTVPDTLNPIFTSNIYVQDFSSLLYEGLVKLDKNQRPLPELSDKWEVSGDGLVWTFHIRDGVFWHDGMPLTAEDVEFTASTILSPSVSSVYKVNFQNVTTFAAVDSSTFRIILKKPDSFTAESMTFPVLPKHYYAGEDILKTPRNMSPVGTGPYRFVSYTDKSSIVLRANDKWWNAKDNGGSSISLPYISEVHIKIYKSSKECINAFQTGDIDVAYIEADYSGKYIGRTNLAIKKYPSRNFDFIALNLSKPALSDKSVRQAMAYAINKNKIINSFLPGAATAADILLNPDSWLYDANIVSYTPNISKAKELLAQGGWKDNNGVMYKYIRGVYVPLNMEILVNNDNNLRLKVAEEIKSQLAEIGINLEIKSVSWDEEFSLINSRVYDMALMGYSVPSIPDISFAYSAAEIYSGRNVSGYNNINVDTYLQNMMSENDSGRKKQTFQQLKATLDEDVPSIGLYFYNNAMLLNKRVRGEVNPCIWDKYNNIAKWYVTIQ